MLALAAGGLAADEEPPAVDDDEAVVPCLRSFSAFSCLSFSSCSSYARS